MPFKLEIFSMQFDDRDSFLEKQFFEESINLNDYTHLIATAATCTVEEAKLMRSDCS